MKAKEEVIVLVWEEEDRGRESRRDHLAFTHRQMTLSDVHILFLRVEVAARWMIGEDQAVGLTAAAITSTITKPHAGRRALGLPSHQHR